MPRLRDYPSHRPEDVIPGWRPEKGLPPTFFGDPEGRAEMEALEEKSAAIRGETEEILSRISEKYTPEQISAAKERLAARRRPPEGFRVPDFSDRNRFEQDVFREIQQRFRIPGGNPFKINPMDAVDEAMVTQWPKVFERTFGILFSDADKLQGKDAKAANDLMLRFKADISKRAQMALNRAEAYHRYAMGKFDTERKRVEGRRVQIEKERLKPPDMKLMVNDKGEQTWHEWKPEFGKWVDTGKLKTPEKEEKPEKPPSKIAREKFAIGKAVSAANYRTALTESERDTTTFQANAPLYNRTNQRNEVAYWQTLGREKTKIVKIPPENLKDGWTPEKIQEAAFAKGITVEQVLGELGIIKLPIELMKPAYKKLPIPKE